jgi:rhodanese-related sulfurtransferase
MRRTIERALLIVALGTGLGLLANKVSPRGIPYITPPKKPIKAEEFLTLDQAKELWSSGAAFFLDAREPEDYAAGHIGNAFSLPAASFEQHFGEVAPMLAPDTAIVVYCDGTECELSHRVADKLHQLDYKNVRILLNGWTVWRGAGLPTETGAKKQ